MIKIAIVGESKEPHMQLKEFLICYGKKNELPLKIYSFPNGLNFISEYSYDYSLIIIYADMAYMDGFETAKLLRKHDEKVPIIFIASQTADAIKGYEVWASDFIVEPIEYKILVQKLDRIIRSAKEDMPYLVSQLNKEIVKVYFSDIYYVTVNGRYVTLHTKHGEVMMRSSMKEIENKFVEHHFVRGDNSSMVNLMYVSQVNAQGAVVNGELIPCSRNRRKNLLEAFKLFLS